MRESLNTYGHSQPKLFYTDNPAADKQFLEGIFPSLTQDVVPVEKYPNLKPFMRPSDVDISVQSTATGIEAALAKILDDLNVEDENSHLVVGFDAEWNVDLVHGGGPQPTAIIQIAYRKWVYIFQVSVYVNLDGSFDNIVMKKIGHFNGKLPLALQMFLANPQILKAGRNVTQDLKRLERESQGSNPAPYTGGVELAKLAKDLGAISDARVGLADICAAVLGVRLDKTTPVRISSSWDSLNLSPQQVEYAASDALVSLQVYHRLRLSRSAVPDKLKETTIPGTPVSVHQDDGQVIAYGILSLEPPASTCRGVNHTPTRARVTVQTTVVPGAILPFHKVSLLSCGPPPFDILVKRTKLHCRNDGADHVTDDLERSSSQFKLADSDKDSELHQLVQFLSQPVPEDADWTEGIDEPEDITENQNVQVHLDGGGHGYDDVNMDLQSPSTKEGLKLLDEIDTNPSTWPSSIRSRVLIDVWHAMARIKISKEHGCHRPFARALRDAIFIPDKEDKMRISAYLESTGSSWEEVLRFNARWLWKRCKRIIPPPELLYPLVKEVFSLYGPLLDSEKKQPLFNTHAWKDARNVLKVIQSGLLSDPPNIPLYYQIGVDKEHGNLPLYRCVRGTNSVEGGVHHSGRRRLPISGVSARHASTRLRDFVLMHNLVVCDNLSLHIYIIFNESIRSALSIDVDLCTVAILMSG